MKNSGIFRKTDSLGRIVLPVEIRKSLNIGIEDYLDIFLSDDAIILRKHQSSCIFCGRRGTLLPYMDKQICPKCRAQIISTCESEDNK